MRPPPGGGGSVGPAALAGVVLAVVAAAGAVGAAERTQTIDLGPGWNSVWLEVAPVYTAGDGVSAEEVGAPLAVEEVFAHPSVSVVARPARSAGTAEFRSEAAEESFDRPGWQVWRRSSELSDNTLSRARGNSAYLVFLEGATAAVIEVAGEVRFHRPDWEADRYNLVGLPVVGDVSFDAFFAASNGRHPTDRIFGLAADGTWSAVDPAGPIRHGEAYWVFADGPSAYAGPVAVAFGGGSADALEFGAGPGDTEIPDPLGPTGEETLPATLLELALTNPGATAQGARLVKVDPATADPPGDALRLFELSPDTGTLAYLNAGQVVDRDLGAVGPGETARLTLGANRNWTAGAAGRENLYRLEFDQSYFWLPARAANPDLLGGEPGVADIAHQGLWVGEVVVAEVSSMTEGGSPLRPTSSRAPFRILLHVDGTTGEACLLGHVFVMQTRSADPEVPTEPVLVVKAEKIPFFEGVALRGGKRVGRRIDAVAYDLPRAIDAASQAGIADDVRDAFGLAAEDTPTGAQVAAYINGQEGRPPALAEVYHTSWPLEGGLGAGEILKTPDAAPLHLDRFHRTNPFRHAFHPGHVAGRAVERALTIAFDPEQAAGRREGTYEERIGGLVNGGLVLRGRVSLQRVSLVGELQ